MPPSTGNTSAPAEIIGLAGSAAPGQTVTFQIAGDLTIRDVTQPVTFDMTAVVDASGLLSGTAAAIVLRGDCTYSTITAQPPEARAG